MKRRVEAETIAIKNRDKNAGITDLIYLFKMYKVDWMKRSCFIWLSPSV